MGRPLTVAQAIEHLNARPGEPVRLYRDGRACFLADWKETETGRWLLSWLEEVAPKRWVTTQAVLDAGDRFAEDVA
jgi:hypothetical protein